MSKVKINFIQSGIYRYFSFTINCFFLRKHIIWKIYFHVIFKFQKTHPTITQIGLGAAMVGFDSHLSEFPVFFSYKTQGNAEYTVLKTHWCKGKKEIISYKLCDICNWIK